MLLVSFMDEDDDHLIITIRIRTIIIYQGREAKAYIWNLEPFVRGGAMVTVSETSSQ